MIFTSRTRGGGVFKEQRSYTLHHSPKLFDRDADKKKKKYPHGRF